MTLYEARTRDGNGVLRENPPWFIGQILTICQPDCSRHLQLVSTGAPNGTRTLDPMTGMPYTSTRRLDLARATECTCGRDGR